MRKKTTRASLNGYADTDIENRIDKVRKEYPTIAFDSNAVKYCNEHDEDKRCRRAITTFMAYLCDDYVKEIANKVLVTLGRRNATPQKPTPKTPTPKTPTPKKTISSDDKECAQLVASYLEANEQYKNWQPRGNVDKTKLKKYLKKHHDGVLDFSQDNAERARKRGYRWQGQEVALRQNHILWGSSPKSCCVQFAEDVEVNAYYRLIHIDSLQPSHVNGQPNIYHFIPEAQPKDRTDTVSHATAEKHARDIKPELLLECATAYSGAPVVNSRGEVIQGNGRADTLKTMFSSYPESVKKYHEALKKFVKENEVEQSSFNVKAVGEETVLVRVMICCDWQSIMFGQYTDTQMTTGGRQTFSGTSVARQLVAKNRMGAFCDTLFTGDEDDDEDNDLSEIISQHGADAVAMLSRERFITAAQMATAVADGEITRDGRDSVRDILVSVLYQGAGDQFDRMFTSKKIPVKVQTAILQTIFRDVRMSDDRKLVPYVQDAIVVFYKIMCTTPSFAKAKRIDEARSIVASWKAQTAMDDNGQLYYPADRFSNLSLEMAALFRTSTQTTIKNFLNEFYDKLSGEGTPSMFAPADDFGRKLTIAEAAKSLLQIDLTPRAALNGFKCRKSRRMTTLGTASPAAITTLPTRDEVERTGDANLLEAFPLCQQIEPYATKVPEAGEAIAAFRQKYAEATGDTLTPPKPTDNAKLVRTRARTTKTAATAKIKILRIRRK